MPAAPVSPIRPSLALFGKLPTAARNENFRGQPLGDVVQRQVQVRLQGTGDLSTRTLVPQTRAAVDLLSGPKGPKFEQVLRGLLATADGQKGVRDVEGITLATSSEGFGVNRLMTALDGQPKEVHDQIAASPPQGTAKYLSELAGSMRYHAEKQGVFAQNMSWIDLSAPASRSLLGAISDGRTARSRKTSELVGTLVHELQHAVSPASEATLIGANGLKPINWLEEGTADVLTWQKPVLRDAAERMGLPYRDFKNWTSSKSGEHAGYPAQRTILTQLLGDAGINVRSRAGIAEATDLLQGAPLERVPGRLADRIIEHQSLPPSIREHLRGAIRDLGEVPQDPTVVHEQQMLARAKALRSHIADIAAGRADGQ